MASSWGAKASIFYYSHPIKSSSFLAINPLHLAHSGRMILGIMKVDAAHNPLVAGSSQLTPYFIKCCGTAVKVFTR